MTLKCSRKTSSSNLKCSADTKKSIKNGGKIKEENWEDSFDFEEKMRENLKNKKMERVMRKFRFFGYSSLKKKQFF